jgi:predicted ribosome quality control (RQC) complex YloA/Tae2 family protein
MAPRGKPADRPDRPNLYEYRLPDGWVVLAGRTDTDNDQLSLKLARPNDWWFHVRGQPGSHVILRSRPATEPSREVLRQAAAIAAYHSKARAGGRVAVSSTQARFVSKPRGAKPGSVNIRRETVLMVRPWIPSPPPPEGTNDHGA